MAMNLKGEYELSVPRSAVWQALNDEHALARCIPGCKEIVRVSDDEMRAVVVTKVGPVSARFKGTVKLRDRKPPESYYISGEGDGGLAGFAKGGAFVVLRETEHGTHLSYEVDVQIGGKLAQLGQRLVAGTAKQSADAFFGNLVKLLDAGSGPLGTPTSDQPSGAPADPAHSPSDGAMNDDALLAWLMERSSNGAVGLRMNSALLRHPYAPLGITALDLCATAAVLLLGALFFHQVSASAAALAAIAAIALHIAVLRRLWKRKIAAILSHRFRKDVKKWNAGWELGAVTLIDSMTGEVCKAPEGNWRSFARGLHDRIDRNIAFKVATSDKNLPA